MDLTVDMENIIGNVSEDYANAQVYNSWMPPDGDYTVLLTGLDAGTVTSGDTYMWWRLDGRILSEGSELDQEEFTVGFFTTKAPGILKGAVAVLSGRKNTSLKEATPILEAAKDAGTIVEVNVSTRKSKKDGQVYTNARINRLVASTPEAKS